MVAQLRTTKGRSARFDLRCSRRAATSLPLPGGPENSTRLPVGATRSIAWRNWAMAAERPIKSAGPPTRARNSSFSRRRRAFSSARSIVTSRRSALNGFSMKSKAPRLMALTAVSMLPWPLIITTGTSG